MSTDIVFLHGAGTGAYDEDALMADSLAAELGGAFTVATPRLPEESDDDEDWSAAIGTALAIATEPVVVAHSAGGYQLLRRMVAAGPSGVAALCLIAVPYPGGDPDWTFEGFELPDDFAAVLAEVPVFLYASEDDEVVPFAHRDRYAAAIPGSVTRTTVGGHQLGNDLSAVAADIRSL